MNNSDYWGSRHEHDDRLGVNKIGRNIRKSPPHQPNSPKPGPQPHVYNINKNDFRSVVQQLTGSSSHQPHQPNPPTNRLQRIRPPKLEPINVNRPQIPSTQMPPRGAGAGAGVRFGSNLYNPPAPYGQQQQSLPANTAESPISAYMRYLQQSIIDPTHRHPQTHSIPSPRMAGLPVPSPRLNVPFHSPAVTSPFGVPSPSGYMNLLSPLSPYPLFSPGYQHAMPVNPVFSFSPVAQPPASPGIGFPSPGFFNISSPMWRN
ncbi:hypothetical protein R6Q57_023221 [Mikania cordata]